MGPCATMFPPLVSSSGGDIGPCESSRKLLPLVTALTVSAKTIIAQIVARSTTDLRSFPIPGTFPPTH